MSKSAAAISSRAARQDGSSTEAEIRECLDRWIEAVGKGSAGPALKLYAPDAILLATFDPYPLTTPTAIEGYLTEFTGRKRLKAMIDESHIHVIDEEAGVASGLYTFRFEAEDGVLRTKKARFLFAFAREPDGEWLIVAHHSSLTPAANVNLPRA